MRGIHFIFDSVQLIYYKCHKVNFRRCGLYIDSPDWIKKKKATNYDEIKWNPERVSNIKPFINKYDWKVINYPSKIDDWKNV